VLLQPAIVNPNTKASNIFMILFPNCFAFMHCQLNLLTITHARQFVPLTKMIGMVRLPAFRKTKSIASATLKV